jgi:hypothetical protein
MKTDPGSFRVAITSVRAEVSRYWKTAALLAAAVAAGVAFAVPVASLHGRLALIPLRGGDLGLAWRAGVQPPAATQQEAVDALGGLLLGSSLGTLAIAAVTILILSLARESERAAEVTVRRAVGAGRRVLLGSAVLEGRRRIVTYVLLRAAAVGAAGIAGGVWFGQAIWSVLAELMPGLDPWDGALVVRFGLVLLLSTLLGALAPALRASRASPASLLSAS